MKYKKNEIDMTEEGRGEVRENARSCLTKYQTLFFLQVHLEQNTPYAQILLNLGVMVRRILCKNIEPNPNSIK